MIYYYIYVVCFSELIVRANDVRDDITDWYYDTVDDDAADLVINNVTFSRLADSVYVAFPSG